MWQQYRKTFVGMQVTIFLVTVGMYLVLHHEWFLAAKFFVVMQVASVIGVFWGQRLRARIRGQA